MEVHQPRRLVIRGEICHSLQPAIDLGAGISLCTHLLEARGPVEMQNGKRPDIAGFTLAIAITLRRTHAGVAGEVICDKTMSLEPMRDPNWLIAVRSGIFDDWFSGGTLQGVLVQGKILFEVFRVVGFDVRGKVIVNPAAVAANVITERGKIADQSLTDGVVVDVESPAVARFARVRPSRDVNRVRSLFHQGPRTHLLQRLDCG